MIILVFIYFAVFALTLLICKCIRLKVKDFPPLRLTKDGIIFYSKEKHRLKLHCAKFLCLGRNVYLKKFNKIVCVQNVDKVFVYKDYVYFTALGKVKIKFNCLNIYKYFVFDIESNYADMKKFKKTAINDIKNHIFDLKNAKILKKYIKIVRNIFKINIVDEQILITQNKFKLAFVVKYFSGGKKKIVKVN